MSLWEVCPEIGVKPKKDDKENVKIYIETFEKNNMALKKKISFLLNCVLCLLEQQEIMDLIKV